MERNDQQLQQELTQLKNEYERLREEKVRAEQDVTNLSRQLDELRTRAQAEYGSSDPAELQVMLQEKRAENERLVSEYRAHLEGIRQGLADVEKG